jgi:hypothetical protein
MKYVCEGCNSEVARLNGGVCLGCVEAVDWSAENDADFDAAEEFYDEE